jgi:outer membrane protein
MKKTFPAALALALAVVGVSAAQEATPRPARIAVIDMARVSAESQLGKSYASQLEKLQNEISEAAAKKQTELQKMDAAIRDLQDELQKQGAVLSQEARDKKQQEIVQKNRDRQAFFEDGQAEIRRMQERAQQQAQSINNEFQVKIRPVVEQVAKDKGYDLVLDSQVAYTVSKDFDVTRDVITAADATLKPAAAKAAPSAGSTPAASPAAPNPAPAAPAPPPSKP